MTSETKISFALSFVSGFVDTAGFIALFNLFTAHITGNLVLAGASLFESGEHGNIAGKLVMLPVFILSVAFTSSLMKYKNASVQKLVLIESLCISCFALAGAFLLDHKTAPGNNAISITASFAVIGMAIQNTYMRKSLSSYTPNTVMTGNFTQFSIDLFNLVDYYLRGKHRNQPASVQPVLNSFKKFSIVLSGFLIGCTLGALLVKLKGLICCLLPAMVLLWVIWQLNFISNFDHQK